VSDLGGPVAADPGVTKEEIVKPDGRYLISYTFADAPQQDAPQAEPDLP